MRRVTTGWFSRSASPDDSHLRSNPEYLAMSDWQKVLHQGVDTLDKLAERFGHDLIDVEGLRPAFENFQMRITPAALEQIKAPGDPMWNQYVPTVQELDIVD